MDRNDLSELHNLIELINLTKVHDIWFNAEIISVWLISSNVFDLIFIVCNFDYITIWLD